MFYTINCSLPQLGLKGGLEIHEINIFLGQIYVSSISLFH